MNAYQRKCLWHDSEKFTDTLLRELLRSDSRELLGADGWRALRAAFDCAVAERIERFEAWQVEETRELDTLREEAEILDRKLAQLRAELAREGGAK